MTLIEIAIKLTQVSYNLSALLKEHELLTSCEISPLKDCAGEIEHLAGELRHVSAEITTTIDKRMAKQHKGTP